MKRLLSWLNSQQAEIRFGLRIAFAGVAAFALAQILHLPQGYWAVFTAVLVTQASLGGSLKAAVDRLIGTFAGAIFGAIVVTFLPHGDALALGIALAVALAPLAVLSALYPALRVAPITVVILLLGGASANEGPFLAALLRTLEVGIGGLVGLLVSVFVLPARGHAVMYEAAEKVLEQLALLLGELSRALASQSDPVLMSQRHQTIQSAFDAMETAAKEAERERRVLLASDADVAPMPRTLRRIYHDLVLIGRIAAQPLWKENEPAAGSFDSFALEGAVFLRGLGAALKLRRTPPPETGVMLALSRLSEMVANMREASTIGTPRHDRLMALIFALEQLERNMRDLVSRAKELARAPVKHVQQEMPAPPLL